MFCNPSDGLRFGHSWGPYDADFRDSPSPGLPRVENDAVGMADLAMMFEELDKDLHLYVYIYTLSNHMCCMYVYNFIIILINLYYNLGLRYDFDSFFINNGDSDWQHIFNPKTRTYCWWTKSCTTQDDDYPIIYRVLTIPGGAGFRPSTVVNCLPSRMMYFPSKSGSPTLRLWTLGIEIGRSSRVLGKGIYVMKCTLDVELMYIFIYIHIYIHVMYHYLKVNVYISATY